MNFSRGSRRLDPASIRLPLIALIDVCLFLLLYFMIAGTIAAEESELSTALKTERGRGGLSGDLQPQMLFVENADGRSRFRLGERAVYDRQSLYNLLAQLPKQTGVVVRVAGDVPVASAATAIQACKDAGFTKVSYVPGR